VTSNETATLDLDDYGRLLRGKTCNFCGGPLSRLIDAYPHSGGWLVKGFQGRQWLSVRCRKCNYDWSLWKLDIPGDVDHLPLPKNSPPLRDLALEAELSGRAECDGQ
jgi:hypothetical protein